MQSTATAPDTLIGYSACPDTPGWVVRHYADGTFDATDTNGRATTARFEVPDLARKYAALAARGRELIDGPVLTSTYPPQVYVPADRRDDEED